jgi:hypothetical protein
MSKLPSFHVIVWVPVDEWSEVPTCQTSLLHPPVSGVVSPEAPIFLACPVSLSGEQGPVLSGEV